MKYPKEIRQWINRQRSKHGKDNGCLPWFVWDNPYIERKLGKNDKQRNRNYGIHDE